jgi:hypothetical protein
LDGGLDRNDESIAKQGMSYLEKARYFYEGVGMDDSEDAMVDATISSYSSRCTKKWGSGFFQAETVEKALERQRVFYESTINQHGEAKEISITQGRNYAKTLYEADHHIEAWKLLNKLIALSQKTHGGEHLHTVKT